MVFLSPFKNNFSKLLRKICAAAIILSLCLQQSGFAQALFQPSAAATAAAAEIFRPVHLRYLSCDAALSTYRLLVDSGAGVPARIIETQTADLMRYFLIGLALPDSVFWVNLRPDAPEAVIDPDLARTDIGRIMLEADVQLKKDLAAYTSPQTGTGRRYWNRLYEKAGELFGPADCSIPAVSRPWIVPGEIILRAGAGNAAAFIYKATLKVMLESEYLPAAGSGAGDERLKMLNDYSAQLIRREILPRLTRDVNTARKYAALRQVYYSLILAQWFKQAHRADPAFAFDTGDLAGLCSQEAWSSADYFTRYRSSFEQGEYNLREPVTTRQGLTVRQYFSGGLRLGHLPLHASGTDPGAASGAALVVRGDADLDPFVSGVKNAVPMKAAVRRQGDALLISIQRAHSGDTVPDGGKQRAENLRSMEKLKTLIVPQVPDDRVAARLKKVGKQALYLPTISITRDFLPEHYSTAGGLRSPRRIRDFPKSLKDIPRVEVIPLKIDDCYVVPFSEVNNGSQAVVLLGQLADSLAPVVIKTYPGDERLCLSDYQGAQLADDLGIGPRVHGIYDNGAGRSWVVVDLVPGDFPESGKQRVTPRTIQEYKEIYRRLQENYLFPYYDFQYFVTPEGHIWVIDPVALVIEGDDQGLSEEEWLIEYAQEYKKGLEVIAQSLKPEEKSGASSREGSSTVKDNLPSDAPALFRERVALPETFRSPGEKGFYQNILEGYSAGQIVDPGDRFVDDHSLISEGVFEENSRGLSAVSLAILEHRFAHNPAGERILIIGEGSGREAGMIKDLAAQRQRPQGLDIVHSIGMSPVAPNYRLLADAESIREDILSYLTGSGGSFPGLEDYYSLVTGKPAVTFEEMRRDHLIHWIRSWPDKPVPLSAVFGLEQAGYRFYRFEAVPHTDKQFIVKLENAQHLFASEARQYTIILDQCGGFYYMCIHNGLEEAVRAVAPLLAKDGIFYVERLPDDMDFVPEEIRLADLNVNVFVDSSAAYRLLMVRADAPFLNEARDWRARAHQLSDGLYEVESIDRFLKSEILADGGSSAQVPGRPAFISRELVLADIATGRATGSIFMPRANLYDPFSYLKYGVDETNTRRLSESFAALLEYVLAQNDSRDTRLLVLGPGAGLECSNVYDLAAAAHSRVLIDTVSLTPLAPHYRLLRDAAEIRALLVEYLSRRGASLPGLETYYEDMTGVVIRHSQDISPEEYLQLIRGNPYKRMPLEVVFSLQNELSSIFERLTVPIIGRQLVVDLETLDRHADYDIIYDNFGGFYYLVVRLGLERAIRTVCALLGREGIVYVEHLPFMRYDPGDVNRINGYIFLRIDRGARLMIMREDSRIASRVLGLFSAQEKSAASVYEVEGFDSFLSRLTAQDGGKIEEARQEARLLTQVQFFRGNVFERGAAAFDRKVEFVLKTIGLDLSAEYKERVDREHPELAREHILEMNLMREIIRECLENAWDAIRSYDELEYIAAAEADIRQPELAQLKPMLEELKRTAVVRPEGYPGGAIGIDFRLESENGREVIKVVITDNGAGEQSASSQRKMLFGNFYKGGAKRALRLSRLILSQLGVDQPYQRKRIGDTTVVTLTVPLDALEPAVARDSDGGMIAPGGIDLRSLHNAASGVAFPGLAPHPAPEVEPVLAARAGRIWKEIERSVENRSLPAAETLENYLSLCLQSPGVLAERKRLFICLAAWCRIEEEQGVQTSPAAQHLLEMAEAS